MPITVPNKAVNKRTAAGTTLAVTIASPTVGNLLVLVAGGFSNVTSIVANSGGVGTWTNVTPPSGTSFTADANHDDADIWYGVVDGTPNTTVTANFASASFMGAFVLEVAGAQKSTENAVAFANDAQATTDSKVITTTTDGDLIVSGLSTFTGSVITPTLPTGYTTGGASQGNAASAAMDCAYLIQTTHGASTMNWTSLNAATFPALGAIAIKAAGGAAAAGNSPRAFAPIPVQAQGRNL